MSMRGCVRYSDEHALSRRVIDGLTLSWMCVGRVDVGSRYGTATALASRRMHGRNEIYECDV